MDLATFGALVLRFQCGDQREKKFCVENLLQTNLCICCALGASFTWSLGWKSICSFCELMRVCVWPCWLFAERNKQRSPLCIVHKAITTYFHTRTLSGAQTISLSLYPPSLSVSLSPSPLPFSLSLSLLNRTIATQ